MLPKKSYLLPPRGCIQAHSLELSAFSVSAIVALDQLCGLLLLLVVIWHGAITRRRGPVDF